MKGFREPQKFVALLVFAYAFLAAYGIENILGQIKKKKIKILASVLIIAIPFAYTPTMFNSFWQQIHTTDYPKDWYEINNYLNQDKQDFNVLFLPWHLYMDFKWIPNLNVKYIILAKEVDYKGYSYLFNQSDIELIKETETLYLFKNKKEVNKFYQANNPNEELISLGYAKESPIKYKIDKPNKKYVIFTEGFNENWKLGEQKPAKLEAVTLYESKGDFVLKYARFNLYLASYIISIVMLLFLLIWINVTI